MKTKAKQITYFHHLLCVCYIGPL